MFIVKLATISLLIICSLLGRVESKSVFGIGTRIVGDQLLLKDVLQAPSIGRSYSPTIRFNYDIPEPITYIEILSEENVLAEVNFSYKNELVAGIITVTNTTLETLTSATPSASSPDETVANSESYKFEVLVTVYGFNETVLNMNPDYVLNRDQDFQGLLQPEESDEEYYNQSDEAVDKNLHAVTEDEDNNGNGDGDDDDDDDDDAVDDDDDDEFDNSDLYIELGHRQKGDYKIYETFHTSPTTTEEPTNHSVVFYYVDTNFITYAKFVIYDSREDKSDPDQEAPVAEYSHLSPTTLKAIITDQDATSLFVQMFLYGYRPEDLPVGYQHHWFSSQLGEPGEGDSVVPTLMTALQRIKMLMNAQQGHSDSTTTIRLTVDNNDDDDDDGDVDDDDDDSNRLDAIFVDKNDDDGDDDDDDGDNDNDDGASSKNNNNLPLCINAAPTLRSILMSDVIVTGSSMCWFLISRIM